MRILSFALSLSLAALGCDKSSSDPIDSGTSKEPPPAASPSTPKPNPVDTRPPAGPPRAIEGLGAVPAWGLDQTTRRCVALPESKAKIEAVRKESDVPLASGLAAGHLDVAAFAK